jgi:hypothetical protein
MKNMYKKSIKKVALIVLMIFQCSILIIPSVSALVLDGNVNEIEWELWYVDTGTPSFTIYTTSDENYAYLGIVTSIEETGKNDLQLAFKGIEKDWAIKLSDVTGTSYVKSKDDTSVTYWGSKKAGLPEGVQIVQGVTDGKVSYEISIAKELLKNSEAFPTNQVWLMVSSNSNGNWIWSILDIPSEEVNFYPDSRAGWWFTFPEDDVPISELDEVPTFVAPEFPLGTILPMLAMLLAMVIGTQKKSMPNL